MNYLDDDGTPVEPEFYVPIIPMILVNGAKGIGTGFSTDVLSYNPLVLMDTLIHKLDGHEDVSQYVNPLPYYQGFKGNVIQVEDSKYLIKGKYNPTGKADEIVVTELPIGTWTDNYKVFLEKLIESKKHVKEYKDMSTDTNVEIIINLLPGTLSNLEAKQVTSHINGVENELKLTTSNKTTNMHLFDAKQRLRKYATTEDIILEYTPVRLEYSHKA